MKSLSIKTSDDQTFKVDWDVARQSQTIRTMLDDQGVKENSDKEDLIEIKEITGPIFVKVLEWCEWYIDQIEDISEEDKQKHELNEWEKKYIKMSAIMMFSLVKASDFLKIRNLTQLMIKAIALRTGITVSTKYLNCVPNMRRIKSKPTTEIRKSEQILTPVPSKLRRIRKPQGKYQVSDEGYTVIGLKAPRNNSQLRRSSRNKHRAGGA